jgi:uncharacterized membrane protein
MYEMEGLRFRVRAACEPDPRKMTDITSSPGSLSSPSPPRPLAMLRLSVSIGVGAAAAVLTVFLGNWRYAPSVGWDAAGIVFCGWIWLAIWPLSPQQTAERATAEDPNRPISDAITLAASVASLGALGLVLVDAHQATGTARLMLALLAVLSVAISWFSVHTIFTLRYALLYYAAPVGGINFNQPEWPDYRDFAYVALTLGMTFQVSDTNLESSVVRATVLRHALLSYLFGAVILAAAVNLIAGLGSGG